MERNEISIEFYDKNIFQKQRWSKRFLFFRQTKTTGITVTGSSSGRRRMIPARILDFCKEVRSIRNGISEHKVFLFTKKPTKLFFDNFLLLW